MAILKNKTQKNFTIISNSILRDKELSMRDRGVLCTICGLPDGWDFSVAGLCSLVPDGKDAISASISRLEETGYMTRDKTRGARGRFTTEIEVFTERRAVSDLPSRKNRHGGTATVNPSECKTYNKKLNIKKDNVKSINLSGQDTGEYQVDGEKQISGYKELIAENIELDNLLEVASNHNEDEVKMVHQIYDVICDMVCFSREKVKIKQVSYPWNAVKAQYLKLRYEHVAGVLNKVVDKDKRIVNMPAYLNSMLYSASLTGTIEVQADIHDDYLKFLRGKPYSR